VTEEVQEIEITDENFEEYFFDVRKHRPKPGQIMAKFTAMAEFTGPQAKRDIMKLLKMDKAQAAHQVMTKLHGAKPPDCYRICREMAEDMLAGLSEQEIIDKPYEFVLEFFFYTQREYVPKNDPHWETIKLIEYDEEEGVYKTKIEI